MPAHELLADHPKRLAGGAVGVKQAGVEADALGGCAVAAPVVDVDPLDQPLELRVPGQVEQVLGGRGLTDLTALVHGPALAGLEEVDAAGLGHPDLRLCHAATEQLEEL